MFKKLLYICISVFLILSCSDDIATSPDMQPEASCDTLKMGTLLSGNSSPTYQLKLYNRNSREIQLSSIILRNAQTSGFRMNVDGMNGSSFTQPEFLRIASGDSLFVFVEATFPQKGNGVETHTDYIDVSCNGRTSSIVLEATSKDVRKLSAYVVTKDETWNNAEEIQIYDSLVIAQNATLTLTDSVTLYLHDKADVVVYGSLHCNGTLDRPVTIRGDRTDWMFDNLPYDNLPAQWGNLYLRKESKDNRFTHTFIRGMSDGIFVDSTDAEFDCCHIKNSNGSLITGYCSVMSLRNSLLSNASGSLLDIVGGSYDIVHCTLANYHFASVMTQEALRISNNDTINKVAVPLHKFEITNTIVWGRQFVPDIAIEYVKPAEGDSIFSYRFDHCLLHAEGTEDNEFIESKWNEDPLFVNIDEKNYTFDFHLQKESPCIGAGNPVVLDKIKTDIEGKTRSATPTIGCYE